MFSVITEDGELMIIVSAWTERNGALLLRVIMLMAAPSHYMQNLMKDAVSWSGVRTVWGPKKCLERTRR